MSTEAKRPRGRPRKIVFGSPDVPPPKLVMPMPELRLSKAHRALIHSMAREVKISPAQVLEDVINQGLPQAREMYADLIECRKRLEQKHNDERRSNDRPLAQTTNLGDSGNGRVAAQPDSGLGEQPDAALLERGHPGESQAAVATAEWDDNVLVVGQE